MQRGLVLLIIIALIGAFFIFDLGQYFTLENLKLQKDALQAAVRENLVLTALVFFLVYVAATALALPAAALLTVAAGAVFGFWLGLVLVSFASTIGATLAFLLTRYLFAESVQSRFGERLSAVNKGIESDGAFYVFGLRLVPLFPFFVVNAVLALTPLKTWTFYWASQLGMLAGTAVFVNAGTQLANVESLGDILSLPLILSFALLGVFPIIARHLLRFLQSEKSAEA